jgi:hypothetical protein
LGPELFQIHVLSGLAIEGEEKTIAKDIRLSLCNGNLKEPVTKAVCELRMDKMRGMVKSTEWTEQEGLLMFRGKIYVPTDCDLCRRIMLQHHDTRITGHAGHWKTLELVLQNYWWPQMSIFIGLYVKTCDLCQRTKVQRSLPAGELHPLEMPLECWDTLSIDFVVELPKSHSFDTIMVIVNTLGKCAHSILSHTTVIAEGTASLFLKEVWKHHGTPLHVVSDHRPQFIAEFTHELYRLLGIKLATSTAYHPQTNGQTEQVNQEMELFLCMFTNQRQDNWDKLLPMGEFAYNNHIHSSLQQTPFMVDTGRHPHMGFKPNQPRSQVVEVREFVERMAKGVEEA